MLIYNKGSSSARYFLTCVSNFEDSRGVLVKEKTFIHKIVCIALSILTALSCMTFFAFAEGETEEPLDAVFYDAEDLNAIMGGKHNTDVSEVLDEKTGVPALRLSSTNDLVDPIVNFEIQGEISADEYPFVAIIAKKNSQCVDMQLFFTTEKLLNPNEKASKRAKYNPNNKWQILVFEMSDLPEWSGKLIKVRVDYFSRASSAEDYCDIAGIVLGKSENAVLNAASGFFAEKLGAVERFADFSDIELGYFNSTYQTTVGISEGNILYTTIGSERFDPQATWKVEEFCSYKGIKPLEAEDFGYMVIKYRVDITHNTKQHFEIFYQAGHRHSAAANYSAQTEYFPEPDWTSLIFEFESRPEWTGTVHSLRLDWCNNISQNMPGEMEISDFVFFKDLKTAKRYADIIDNIQVSRVWREEEKETEEVTWADGEDGTLDIGITEEETTQPIETTEETLPEFIETTEETVEIITEETIENITEDISEEVSTEEIPESAQTTEKLEEESEEKPNPDIPSDITVPTLPGDDNASESGSQAPFIIACIILALLSVASIVTVVVIRAKNKE